MARVSRGYGQGSVAEDRVLLGRGVQRGMTFGAQSGGSRERIERD